MKKRQILVTLAVFLSMAFFSGAAIMMARDHAKRPAASEFGAGPRRSAEGLYTATLDLPDDLKPRRMYVIRATVFDADGKKLDGATINVDGGMPQHGHGLPTQPRVTRELGNGAYEISGVRFNMGGWWELKLTITTPAGTDTVTFNLDL